MENTSLTEFARVDESSECAAYEAEREAELESRDTVPCEPPTLDRETLLTMSDDEIAVYYGATLSGRRGRFCPCG